MADMTSSEVKGNKVLDSKAWADIQAKYENGEPLKDLALRNGICISAISKRAKRHGWKKHGEMKTKALEEARGKAGAALAMTYEEAVKDANERHLKYYKFSDGVLQMFLLQYKKLVEWVDKENDRQKALALRDGRNEPQPYIPCKEIHAYSCIVSCLFRSVEAQRTILGIDTPLLKKDDPNRGLTAMFENLRESYEKHYGQREGCDQCTKKQH